MAQAETTAAPMDRAMAPWLLPGLGLCGLLLMGALLREQHCFWLDACGVPRLLRASLEQGFKPGVATFAALLAGLTLLHLRPLAGWLPAAAAPRHVSGRLPSRVQRLAVQNLNVDNLLRQPLTWLWIAFAVLLFAVCIDNLFNLAVGLPLHGSVTPLVQCCCGG
jgi:hypothetical protein